MTNIMPKRHFTFQRDSSMRLKGHTKYYYVYDRTLFPRNHTIGQYCYYHYYPLFVLVNCAILPIRITNEFVLLKPTVFTYQSFLNISSNFDSWCMAKKLIVINYGITNKI